MSLDCEGKGETCDFPGCGEFDFLPFYCRKCGGHFCKVHSALDSHQCPEELTDPETTTKEEQGHQGSDASGISSRVVGNRSAAALPPSRYTSDDQQLFSTRLTKCHFCHGLFSAVQLLPCEQCTSNPSLSSYQKEEKIEGITCSSEKNRNCDVLDDDSPLLLYCLAHRHHDQHSHHGASSTSMPRDTAEKEGSEKSCCNNRFMHCDLCNCLVKEVEWEAHLQSKRHSSLSLKEQQQQQQLEHHPFVERKVEIGKAREGGETMVAGGPRTTTTRRSYMQQRLRLGRFRSGASEGRRCIVVSGLVFPWEKAGVAAQQNSKEDQGEQKNEEGKKRARSCASSVNYFFGRPLCCQLASGCSIGNVLDSLLGFIVNESREPTTTTITTTSAAPSNSRSGTVKKEQKIQYEEDYQRRPFRRLQAFALVSLARTDEKNDVESLGRLSVSSKKVDNEEDVFSSSLLVPLSNNLLVDEVFPKAQNEEGTIFVFPAAAEAASVYSSMTSSTIAKQQEEQKEQGFNITPINSGSSGLKVSNDTAFSLLQLLNYFCANSTCGVSCSSLIGEGDVEVFKERLWPSLQSLPRMKKNNEKEYSAASGQKDVIDEKGSTKESDPVKTSKEIMSSPSEHEGVVAIVKDDETPCFSKNQKVVFRPGRVAPLGSSKSISASRRVIVAVLAITAPNSTPSSSSGGNVMAMGSIAKASSNGEHSNKSSDSVSAKGYFFRLERAACVAVDIEWPIGKILDTFVNEMQLRPRTDAEQLDRDKRFHLIDVKRQQCLLCNPPSKGTPSNQGEVEKKSRVLENGDLVAIAVGCRLPASLFEQLRAIRW